MHMECMGTPSSSLEDYLEAICQITNDKGAARGKSIARQHVLKGRSVTGSLLLNECKGLVNFAPYGLIMLTLHGHWFAKNIARRNQALYKSLFEILILGAKTAESTTRHLEHIICNLVLDRLIQFVGFVEQCSRGGSKRINGLTHNRRDKEDNRIYQECIQQCVEYPKTAPAGFGPHRRNRHS